MAGQGWKQPGLEIDGKPPTGRFASFTPFNAPIDQVLMQIKDKGALMFPGKLKGDPRKRSRDKYCHFHCDYGHDTSDCYNLKQQIEALSRQGKAAQRENKHPKPPLGDIRRIVGVTTTSGSSKKACKTYLRMVQNV